jgi:uncharacterized protein YjcR
MNKNAAAEILFLEGVSQKEISTILGISENTLSKWRATGKWTEKKVNQDMLENNSVQRILKMIDYTTRIMNKRIDEWEKDDTMQMIDKGEIDALSKLFATIRRDSKKFADYVSVLKEFFEWLQHKDIDIAKQLTLPADEFINFKRQSF